MTPTVLAIALVHGVLVVAIAALTRSRVGTTIGALVAAGIAIGLGSPQYMLVDLLAVGGAYWLCMLTLPRKQRRPQREAHPLVLKEKPPTGWIWVGVAASLATFVALTTLELSSRRTPTPRPALSPTAPAALPQPASKAVPAVSSPSEVKRVSPEAARKAEEARREATMQQLRDSCQPPSCKVNY